jgi:hypothetical protein
VDEKTVKRRLLVLHDAADVLQALRPEMPAYESYIDLARRRLQMIADRYTAQAALTELSLSDRKPPQRVNPRGRRKAAKKPSGLCPCNDPGCTRPHIKPEPPMNNNNIEEENEG